MMKQVKVRWRVYALFLSLIAFLLLFLVSKHWVILFYREVSTNDWELVQGKVIKFEMLTRLSKRRGDRHRYQMFKPRVLYNYQWDGKIYSGSKAVWIDYYETNETDSGDSLYDKGMQLKWAYDNDSHINIFVNPVNPKESIIFRESARSVYIVGFFSSLLSGLPFFCLIYFSLCKTWFFLDLRKHTKNN